VEGKQGQGVGEKRNSRKGKRGDETEVPVKFNRRGNTIKKEREEILKGTSFQIHFR